MRLAAVLFTLFLAGSASVPLALSEPACAPVLQRTTGCASATNDGSDVTLNGTATKPGSGHGKGKSGHATAPADPFTIVRAKLGVINPLTISDLAKFPPRPGLDHMEPNGWMVVGLDTNFYSTIGDEVEAGTLLGQPASVRFIPVAWHWSYGDGKSATRATPGAPWSAQGIEAFDPTRTSHIYTSAGTYFIDLDITFAAEYTFAGGEWTPVDGTLTVPANRLKATAGDAKTVLVNHDCVANPKGPGC